MADLESSAEGMASPMPWIKLYTEFLDDLKVRRLPELAQLRFIELCLLAGLCDCEGVLATSGEAMTDEDIAWRLRVPLEQLTTDLRTLAAARLVVRTDDGWLIPAFAERQGRKHSEDRARWRGLKARQRSRNVLNVSSEDSSEESSRDSSEESSLGPRPVPRKEGEGEEEERREEESREEGAIAPAPPAPPRQPAGKKPQKVGVRSDPRTKGPEVQAFFRVTGRYPDHQLYDEVIAAARGKSEAQLAPYYKAWLARGYNPKAVTWLTEWAASGTIPGQRANGKGHAADSRSAIEEYRNRRKLNGK